MRKLFLNVAGFAAMLALYVLTTSQKTLDKEKFYYAFNEKIYLTESPDKFLVKATSKEKAASIQARLRNFLPSPNKILRQGEASFTVDLKGSNKKLSELIKDEADNVLLTKPACRYQGQELYYADEILVESKNGVSIRDVLRNLNLTNSVTIKQKQFYAVLTITPTLDACDVANLIQETGLVKYCHPNFIMPVERHQVIPNDTYFDNQFYLRNTGQVFNPVENHFGLPNADIRASFAWNVTTGNNNIVVAVIDEGVTADHPDLPNSRQVRLNGSNFVPGQNANDPTPDLNNNHGNSCAGIIAATQNNNEGITGIAPNVRIMPIKVFGQNSSADNNGFAAAIDLAWQNGAHVISNSWGVSVTNPNFNPAIVAAINRAVTQGRGGLGSVVVFSASNTARRSFGNQGIVGFPSNVQIGGVLTVGASDRDDLQADYSPLSNAASPNNQIIDIVAPSHRAYPPEAYFPEVGGIFGEGFEVWTMDIPGNNGYNQWNNPDFPRVAPAFGEVLPNFGVNNLSYTGRFGGTSAACPQVAAVAALLLSLNNNLTQQQVFDILVQSAEDVGGYAYNANGWCPELGNGRLNACAALAQVFQPSSQIQSADQFCGNSTFTLTNVPAGAIVTWTSSDNSIASINPSVGNPITILGQGTGTAVITATVTPQAGGCFNAYTVTKQISTWPEYNGFEQITDDVSGTAPFCTGTWIHASAPAFNSAYNYQWTATGSIQVVAGQGTPTVTVHGNTAGSGTLSVLVQTHCGSYTITKNYYVGTQLFGRGRLPLEAVSVNCQTRQVVLNAEQPSTTTYVDYHWTLTEYGFNNVPLGTTSYTSQTNVFTFTLNPLTQSGTICLQVEMAGCGISPQYCYSFSLPCRNLRTVKPGTEVMTLTAESKAGATLYPNPVKDLVSVRISEAPLTPVEATVFDATGKKMLAKTFAKGMMLIEVPARFSKGHYFLQLRYNGKTQTLKFSKQ